MQPWYIKIGQVSTLSAIMTLDLFVIGHATMDIKGITEKSQSETIKAVMTTIYYIFQNSATGFLTSVTR